MPPVNERPMPPDLELRFERAGDADAVEALYRSAFGPGRFARTAYRVRESARHDPLTSFVADRSGLIIGAVRQTKVTVGDAPAYLLGPLAVAETAAKRGIGRALLTRTIAAAADSAADAIVLVGDPSFYAAAGFLPAEGIALPGPVEAHRLLVLTLRRPIGGKLTAEPWGDRPSA